ncbi:conjugal transfer protein TraF [Colwellia demingiae]|uniref:Conjugal transfer protein TraF n=1 Tax=Colwellia demingiae TaxID=89401 RepID=A0A5C6QR23_9GAMM|nr:conjugal transfer protein TraF [Colwellia demingiae]TWX71012.1 conjugal transfer protein TraF [Colwellia demingiae]
MPFFSLILLKKHFLEITVKRNSLAAVMTFLSLSALSDIAWADIQPRSASLNYSQKSLSNAGNPAAAALIVARKDPHVMTGGSIEIGGGIEYGDLDELFYKIDELSLLFNPPSEGDNGTGNELPPTPENPIRNYTWEDLFSEYPELEDRLDIVKKKVVTTAGLLALIAAEGYGKAEATSEASFVLNEDLFGGTLLFGMAYKGNSKAIGIFEEITLDSDYAKAQLKTIPDFDENDPIQELDLSGGITLFYDPANQRIKMSVENDSLLLIKATKIAQFSLSYSRNAIHSDAGDLYWGIKPTFYRVGLTHANTRIGDITDTEELFDDINNADFIYENGFDVDLGLVWAAEHYQLGASVNSLFEHSYKFPEFDRESFTSLKILSQLNEQSVYTMERQLKLEAGIFTDQRNWSLNVELDANPVEDPMHDDYQWFTLTGGYAADSWWLPSARLGFSRNLAGSKLAYINAGVTVMKFINLDVATTLDTVTLEGSEMRRGANIRLGVQFDY